MKGELKSRPKSAEIEFAIANLYYDNSRWPDAIDMYRQLFERAQKPIDKYLDLRRKTPPARTAEKPGNCLNGVPPSFAAFVAAAEKRVQEGNASGALFCYEQALLPLSVALNRSANAWYLIGNEDKAQELHRQALELNPADSDELFFMGAMLFETGDGNLPRLREAKDFWNRFLRVAPEATDAERRRIVTKDLVRLQFALDNHGKIPNEAPAAARSMGTGPIQPPAPPPVLNEAQRQLMATSNHKGAALLAAKSWAAARDAFAVARRMNPGNPEAARGQGIALMNLGRLLEAEAALRDALGREPNDAQALAQLGEVFFRSAHYAGAAKFWLQVMDEDGEMGRKLGLPGKIQQAEQLQ